MKPVRVAAAKAGQTPSSKYLGEDLRGGRALGAFSANASPVTREGREREKERGEVGRSVDP